MKTKNDSWNRFEATASEKFFNRIGKYLGHEGHPVSI